MEEALSQNGELMENFKARGLELQTENRDLKREVD